MLSYRLNYRRLIPERIHLNIPGKVSASCLDKSSFGLVTKSEYAAADFR